MSKPRFQLFLTWNLAMLPCALGACSSVTENGVDDSSAELVVTTSQALTAADVTRVAVTVTGGGMATPIVRDSVRTGGAWRGIIDGLPPGADRTFHGDAYGASNALLYTGEAHAAIVARQRATVQLPLQPTAPPAAFQDAVPIIDALSASSKAVVPGAVVTLALQAHDPDPTDPIVYAWSATGGAFSSTSSASTSWTSPATEGVYTLTATVTDGKGARATIELQVDVAAANAPDRVVGNPWVPVNTGLYGGSVAKVATDPADANVAWAASTGGLFRTMDGSTWSSVSAPFDSSASAVAISPSDGNVVLAASSSKVYRSQDCGSTWTLVAGLPAGTGAVDISFDKSNPTRVFLSPSFGGVYRSTNGGVSFVPIAGSPTRAQQVVVDPTSSMRVYAATSDGGGFWRSFDGGDTWTASSTGLPSGQFGTCIAVDWAQPNIVHYGKDGFPNNGLFRSIDSGASFSTVSTTPTTPFPYAVAVDALDHTIVLAGSWNNGIFRSTTTGASFSTVTMAEFDSSNPIMSLAMSPVAPSIGWAGTLQGFGGAPGIYKTSDRGLNWAVANAGLTNTNPRVLIVDPTNPNVLHTNVHRVSRTTTGGASWSASSTGLSAQTVVDMYRDPSVPSVVWLTNHYQGVHRSTDNGVTWTRVASMTDPNDNLVRIAPGSPRTVFVTAVDKVYKTTDDGATFPQVTTFPAGFINAWAIARSNPQVMYISLPWAGETQGMHRTTDGGTTWTKVRTTVAGEIVVDPNNPDVVYALNQNENELARSSDGGASWTTSATTDAKSLAIAPSASNVLYMSTNTGIVRRSQDGGVTWVDASRGLPPLALWRLAVSPTDPNTVFTTTEGRGIFKTTTGGR